MDKLLDLRSVSKRPFHIQELRILTNLVLNDYLENDSDEDVILRVMGSLEKLLIKISNTVKSSPEVWEIISVFYFKIGNVSESIENRIKQVKIWAHIFFPVNKIILHYKAP
jgi:hypothetical protein